MASRAGNPDVRHLLLKSSIPTNPMFFQCGDLFMVFSFCPSRWAVREGVSSHIIREHNFRKTDTLPLQNVGGDTSNFHIERSLAAGRKIGRKPSKDFPAPSLGTFFNTIKTPFVGSTYSHQKVCSGSFIEHMFLNEGSATGLPGSNRGPNRGEGGRGGNVKQGCGCSKGCHHYFSS